MDDKVDQQLICSLRYYSLVVGLACAASHVFYDGALSSSLLTSLLYTITFHYGSSSNYNHTNLRAQWRTFKLKTILHVFSTTLLAVLRIALLSVHENRGTTVTLFLSYLQLFVSFTENFTVLCRLERPSLRRHGLRRTRDIYAAAG